MNNEKNREIEESKKKGFVVNLVSVWSVPNFFIIFFSYTLMESTNYGLLFWLPKYLDEMGMSTYKA